MFENTKAFSGFSVDDVPQAKRFYEETLGLRTSEEGEGLLVLHLAGDRDTLVYPKPEHTPASFTVLNFPVDDIEQTVDELVERGVRFERYAGTDMETDEQGIFRGGGPLIAWFKDPAGTSCRCSRRHKGAPAEAPLKGSAPRQARHGAQAAASGASE